MSGLAGERSPRTQSASSKGAKDKTQKLPTELGGARLIEAYRLMQTSRMLDQKMLVLLKQGKSFFHIGCMGHESAQVAAAFALERGRDWVYP
jgi:2-oxoisovalerate dehydrogenase E1 component